MNRVEQPPLRKDAERSRAAILVAARELFAAGRDVPMYEIARRAGVGQATLYRHFPDRSTVIAALAREHVARIEAIAAEHEGDQLLLSVMRAAADMLVSLHDVVRHLREEATLAPVLDELRERMLTVLEAAARAPGSAAPLRAGIQASDLQLVLSMITGALSGIADPAQRTTVARRALDVALGGILERPASERARSATRRDAGE